jgi:hypothetical protein
MCVCMNVCPDIFSSPMYVDDAAHLPRRLSKNIRHGEKYLKQLADRRKSMLFASAAFVAMTAVLLGATLSIIHYIK